MTSMKTNRASNLQDQRNRPRITEFLTSTPPSRIQSRFAAGTGASSANCGFACACNNSFTFKWFYLPKVIIDLSCQISIILHLIDSDP